MTALFSCIEYMSNPLLLTSGSDDVLHLCVGGARGGSGRGHGDPKDPGSRPTER